MSREVKAAQSYSDKIMRLIPTEIVGAYMVLAGLLGFLPDPVAGTATTSGVAALPLIPEPQLKAILIQVVFVVLVALTPAYLWRIGKVTKAVQLVISTITFAIWVYTLGGPFVVWGVYYPLVGSVVLVLWSLMIPLAISESGARKVRTPKVVGE